MEFGGTVASPPIFTVLPFPMISVTRIILLLLSSFVLYTRDDMVRPGACD